MSADQLLDSPIRLAVWGDDFPFELFEPAPREAAINETAAERVIERALEIVRRHRDAGTIWGANGITSGAVLDELADVGFWGLLVGTEFSGSGATLAEFIACVQKMSAIEPAVMGLGTVHSCIGATNAIQHFGTDEQRRRFLPRLASGRRQAIFALTEPGAGTDLTAIRTTATRDGDDYLVTGEKTFITNAAPGRIAALVCRIDGQPAVLICELPDLENENFRIVRYGQHALKHTLNAGLAFQDFRVSAANRLQPGTGNGLTIAYHGLNRGRTALCAAAAGNLRRMLKALLPWCHERVTYGAPLADRELVRRRVGRLASLIVGCDALSAWAAGVLDQGFRGEMECIVAKNFAAEAQHEAAIDILMKTFGGRSFLHGNLFGDGIHEFLVPSIYEGEGEMLSLALLRSLVKDLHEVSARLARFGQLSVPPVMRNNGLEIPTLVEQASHGLKQMGREIKSFVQQHGAELAARQCRAAELSQRVQRFIAVVVIGLYGAQHPLPIVREAADVLCADQLRALNGRRPNDAQLRQITSLGESVLTANETLS